MAFVTTNKTRLHREEEGGSKSAGYLNKMHDSPERILSVIQIGITLVAAISAVVSGAFSNEYITPMLMKKFDISDDMAEVITITLVVVPLTFLTVLIGELVPKSIAIKYSMRVSLLVAPGLRVAEKALGFLVNPLEKMTNSIVNLFLRNKPHPKFQDEANQISIQDLKREHKEYVHNIIDLDVKAVRKAMLDWKNVKWVDSKRDGQSIEECFLQTNLTRLPVLDNGEVYGFIHLKEFLQVMNAGETENWLSYIRPPIFISPELKLITALRMMKKYKVQILIVGTAQHPLGIVTLEDILEEVVGDIVDETEDKKIVVFLRHMVIRK